MESLLLNVKVSHCDLVTQQRLENETCLMDVNKITAIGNSSAQDFQCLLAFCVACIWLRVESNQALVYAIIPSFYFGSCRAHIDYKSDQAWAP